MFWLVEFDSCKSVQLNCCAMNQPTALSQIDIDLGDRSYPILIGESLINDPLTFSDLPNAKTALIVSNPVVAGLFLASLRLALLQKFQQVHVLLLPDGESHKTLQSLNLVFDSLLLHECDRKTVLFALGGGVVGDMTGFAAACYMRGVPFVQIPTTLLAQVDSSVGGKTAINHRLGKNMIGAFYQPLKVVCDLATLATLPQRELSAGLAEVIKYGPIADMDFFDWIDANIDALLARDPGVLAYAVKRSCEIKARVVSQDERDYGLRANLNFGHTFGHAIETGMGYGKWLHGEAVGCGMVMAAELSCRLGRVDRQFVERLKALILRAGLPVIGPILAGTPADLPMDNAQRYLSLMRLDKKSESGNIKFVVIDGPGRATVVSAPDELVTEVINDCCSAR